MVVYHGNCEKLHSVPRSGEEGMVEEGGEAIRKLCYTYIYTYAYIMGRGEEGKGAIEGSGCRGKAAVGRSRGN